MFNRQFDMFKAKIRLVYIAMMSAGILHCTAVIMVIKVQKKVEIKPAPKLTNDATVYAQKAWTLINTVEHLVYENNSAKLMTKFVNLYAN